MRVLLRNCRYDERRRHFVLRMIARGWSVAKSAAAGGVATSTARDWMNGWLLENGVHSELNCGVEGETGPRPLVAFRGAYR